MNITVTVENQGNFTETFVVVIAPFEDIVSPTLEQWDTFWSMGDVNRDGYIDQTDLDIINNKFMWIGPPAKT